MLDARVTKISALSVIAHFTHFEAVYLMMICCKINYNKGIVVPTEGSARLRASVPYSRKHLQQRLSKSINGESSTHTNNYIEFGKSYIKIVNTWPSPWFSVLFTTCKLLKYFKLKVPRKYHMNSVWIYKIYCSWSPVFCVRVIMSYSLHHYDWCYRNR